MDSTLPLQEAESSMNPIQVHHALLCEREAEFRMWLASNEGGRYIGFCNLGTLASPDYFLIIGSRLVLTMRLERDCSLSIIAATVIYPEET
jgi:hypothetical protein